MTNLTGISNWKLTVQRENERIIILRATTCDISAVLPDELFGLPVTALSDRALSPSAAEIDGETLLLGNGRAQDGWDNGKLQELTVPESVTEIGSYAFYNCRSLRTLHLTDSVCRLGAEAFMNCRAFHTLKKKKKKDTRFYRRVGRASACSFRNTMNCTRKTAQPTILIIPSRAPAIPITTCFETRFSICRIMTACGRIC